MRADQHPTTDVLVDLELAVARRADELAGAGLLCPTPLNLHCWLQAEQEILPKVEAFLREGSPHHSATDQVAECA